MGWVVENVNTGLRASNIKDTAEEAYKDFITLGSEAACRDAGKLKIEGKEYIVNDGDVMHFRFNV